ncbi:MAG: hypothetical protein JJE21_10495 [Spirochaetaceae bacterium]|nr:hypothetical protein [Spirochaetaceae bacterium]
MTDKQNAALTVAATALVNRFGSIEISMLTNKIHPELKGVKKTTLVKELKNIENENFSVQNDILKISYYTKSYDRSDAIIASFADFEEWKVITWEDIKEYSNSHNFPLSKEAEDFFARYIKSTHISANAKDIFSFRLSNFVNTQEYFYNSSLSRYILEPYGLHFYDQELLTSAYNAIAHQTSWLRAGRTADKKIAQSWRVRADSSVPRFNKKMRNAIDKIATASVKLYGIIPLSKLRKVINTYHSDWCVKKDELALYFSNFTEETGLFLFDKYLGTTDLYNWSLEYFQEATLNSIDTVGYSNYKANKGNYKAVTTFNTGKVLQFVVQQLINEQNGKPIFVPSEKELLNFANPSYVKETAGYKTFENLYISKGGYYSNNIDEFRRIFNIYSNMVGDDVTSIISDFFKAIKIETPDSKLSESSKSDIMQLSQGAFANAPRWRHYGISSSEIINIGKKNS